MDGISQLTATLNYFHPINSNVEEYLKGQVLTCSFRKGKLLVKTGEICQQVYFINKGAVRGYVKDGAKDITTWISAEGEMVTSISGFEGKIPSIENIQAIEDCKLLALTFTDIQHLYDKFPEFHIVARKLLQEYYRDAEGRALIARLTNAEKKYKYFLTNHSHLANRIPLKYIASFLGITLETLSRVRKKISKESE